MNTRCYHLDVFWDDEFRHLDYRTESPNPDDVAAWLAQGYQPKLCGEMADMRGRQPSWNQRFIDIFEDRGWKNVGTSYYKMTSGAVMPVHQDRYTRYLELFDLAGRESSIWRAIVLMEDWRPGHYLEVEGKPFVEWQAGMVVEWCYDTPHMAANVGLDPRYTLQITGHL